MDDLDLPPAHHAGGVMPPTMSHDQAVIGWLATRPTLPTLTRDLLIDVLILWEALAPRRNRHRHRRAPPRDRPATAATPPAP